MPRLTKDQIHYARTWSMDCDWPDLEPNDVFTLSDFDVQRAIAWHYDGGIKGFIYDCQ